MQSVAIIGAGISGLALGQCLKKNFRVKIFEKAAKPGGLIQCDVVNGNLFHKVGGHVFNTKDKPVSDWFWSFFDRENEFVKAKRNAKILLGGKLIGYPIEDHLYQLDEELSEKILHDLSKIDQSESVNSTNDFQAFLINRFGQTLFDIYFRPYNTKIWKADLSTIPLEWLAGKLPMPDIKSIFLHNIHRLEEKEMVHSTFYYPKEGGGQFVANRLAQGLEIDYTYTIDWIEKKDYSFTINGEHTFDKVVYTGDVRRLRSLLNMDVPEIDKAVREIEHLQSVGLSNILCECDPCELSWLYLPEPTTKAHRIIYTGNLSHFNSPGRGRISCVVEFSGQVSRQLMEEEIKNLPGNLKPLAFNFEANAYVIQDHYTRRKISQLKSLLEPQGMYLLGRFAEWEYYNMDKAIEASFILQEHITPAPLS